MVIFHNYVSLPEGTQKCWFAVDVCFNQWSKRWTIYINFPRGKRIYVNWANQETIFLWRSQTWEILGTLNPIVYHWLVVWNIFYFSIYWECHNPNCYSLHHFSEGQVETTNQIIMAVSVVEMAIVAKASGGSRGITARAQLCVSRGAW